MTTSSSRPCMGQVRRAGQRVGRERRRKSVSFSSFRSEMSILATFSDKRVAQSSLAFKINSPEMFKSHSSEPATEKSHSTRLQLEGTVCRQLPLTSISHEMSKRRHGGLGLHQRVCTPFNINIHHRFPFLAFDVSRGRWLFPAVSTNNYRKMGNVGRGPRPVQIG